VSGLAADRYGGCLMQESFKEQCMGRELSASACADGELLPHKAGNLAETTYDFH